MVEEHSAFAPPTPISLRRWLIGHSKMQVRA
jgi:hypothetical protein